MFVFFVCYRFRVLRTTIGITPDRTKRVILGCCALHNFMRKKYPQLSNAEVDQEFGLNRSLVPGSWRGQEGMMAMERLKGNHATNAGKSYRDYLKRYFLSDVGKVSWQEKQARLVN